MLYIRFKFHLSLRECEGFFISLIALCHRNEKVPCYTLVCRRMKTLSLPKRLLEKRAVTDSGLDTTGLKVYGAGEWRAKRYGGKARWIKIHLAMDLKSKKLILAEEGPEHQHDTTYLREALKGMSRKKGQVLIDGLGDSQKCYELAKKHHKELITPSKQGAILRKEKYYQKRNEAVQAIRGLGGDKLARSIWGKLVGDNKRVEIENLIARWKGMHEGALKSRGKERITKEVKIKALMLNTMIEQERVA